MIFSIDILCPRLYDTQISNSQMEYGKINVRERLDFLFDILTICKTKLYCKVIQSLDYS